MTEKKPKNKYKKQDLSIKKTTKKQKSKENQKENNNKLLLFIKKNLTKKNIFYLIVFILDITIIIYSARNNFANYVSTDKNKSIFIGETKNLLFGRNYITIITTIFFFGYIALSNKILFKQKNTNKNLIFLFAFLLILNISLFYIFTKRVY